MATIEVDFDVYKELTVRRATENVTYNNVIRKLLKLDTAPTPSISPIRKGATFKGVFFPDGTELRAIYKGKTYTAEIKKGAWVSSDGITHNSPSEAAVKITGKNWNGWRFWYCKRPGDTTWRLIDSDRSLESLV